MKIKLDKFGLKVVEKGLKTCEKRLKMNCKLVSSCDIILMCIVKEVIAVMEKQIFAALEIADHEIRLVIGEFFNTRFNVLKVERVSCSGIVNLQILNKEAVTSTIRRTLANASNRIGSRIERVLLSIPSKNARRVSMKVAIPVESYDRKVTLLDIKKAVRKAMESKLDKSLALINVVCTKYTCNGITTRRMPIGEICDQLTVQIDLLCADRDLTYNIVSCVEDAGCNVMDVSLDCYAIAKEACLFEQTVDQNVIVLKLEEQMTTMALLFDGKLISSEVLDEGFGSWIKALANKYRLPQDIATRLCKYNGKLDLNHTSESPIYIWSRNQVTYTISESELCNEILEPVENWVNTLSEACKEIIATRKTVVVLTGEGADVQNLSESLKEALGCEVRRYVPETLGVRSPALSCCLGLFYAYKDQQEVMGTFDCSINMNEFMKSIELKQMKPQQENEENTITGKLKSILFDTKE